ncbi:4-(cytidine 5'-diphospho)-2-C-methyl-D-erythritol kinase [Erythrobacter sp. SCSIO 43205]|uniref:4-(cytidine 5'-diphospho)-2-C-methyl-D-erythritol kinase n=1 Tax=Erythrobacter sp. SCSIO 43205 TaxID=2779361 RepID=UPI001CA8C629|nr:4-(cytidine 5'-diphospho)-2-C-methyl-D-erythritol kinase [Erythrobacter sp. SCSIO 43205]UAB77285.1 4-(cytidine 5'-diphospho)-2-C-methyl-D-erythritol kinase [Erythrobacter sp. SCSIO 43205]
MTYNETAYAKINLALHVRKRREDGYHELETLFAFVDAGDTLSAQTSEQDQVTTLGEFAAGIDDPFDNLVAKALSVLPRPRDFEQGLNITLEKNLPVAAGLGGGSADAGAVFRLVERLHGLPDDWQERAAKLGADVPSCVRSETAIGRGTGTELEPLEDDLKGTPVLLVNPRITLSTASVFKAWGQKDLGPLPEGTARDIAEQGRNDLDEPAFALCPVIPEVLAELAKDNAWLTRMSGSGATCFALYEEESARDDALKRLKTERPDWWTLGGKLR